LNQVFKNTSFYTIGNILPQAANFLLLPIYTHYLSTSDYGIISSMQILSSILLIFLTLSIERSIYRMYFDYNTENQRKDYLGTITFSILLISMIVLIPIYFLKNNIANIYRTIPFYPYYFIAIVTSYLSILQLVPKLYFQINEKAEKFVFFSLSQFALNTSLVLWFVINKKEGAFGILKAELYTNFIIAPLALFLTYKIINFTFKMTMLKKSLVFSTPMIPGLLSAFILNLSDRIFIERYFSTSEVGLYSLAYKISGIIGLIGGSFLIAYGPLFYKYANSEDQKEAKIYLSKYNQKYIMFILIISFVITFFSKEAIRMFLSKNYSESYKIIPIISLSYITIQVSSLLNLMIYQSKKSFAIMIIGILSALFTICINYALIPKFGSFGAAYATFFSFFMLFILTFKYAQKFYYIPINWKPILSLLFFLVLIYYLFEYFIVFNLTITITLKIITFLIVLFLSRNNLFDLKNMLKKST